MYSGRNNRKYSKNVVKAFTSEDFADTIQIITKLLRNITEEILI